MLHAERTVTSETPRPSTASRAVAFGRGEENWATRLVPEGLPLLIGVRRIGDTAVVDLFGRIAIGKGDEPFRERLREVLDSGVRRVVLDLEYVAYVDTVGLAELVACRHEAARRGSTVALRRPSARIRKILEVTRLADVFEVAEDGGSTPRER